MINVKESDWKKYKELVPLWQERYMEKLLQEYQQEIVNKKLASSCFWKLEKKINKDKHSLGVIIDMRRSTMVGNIMTMLDERIIQEEDVAPFSDELKEEVKHLF